MNANRPHRTTVCPAGPSQPRRARKPWRARALAPIYGRVEARGGRPFATAKAAHRRSGEGRELETTRISARRRPIVRGCGRFQKSISFCSRPARVRITAPALRAARQGQRGGSRLARPGGRVARRCCCYDARSRASSGYKRPRHRASSRTQAYLRPYAPLARADRDARGSPGGPERWPNLQAR